MRKQPADVDDDIGVEPGQGLGDHRPRLLVGDSLVNTGEAEQNREAAGKLMDVIPHGTRGQGAPGRGEQGGEAAGDGYAVAGCEVAAKGIGFHEEDTPTCRPARRDGGRRGGDPRGALDGSEGNESHLAPSVTSDRPIWSAAA